MKNQVTKRCTVTMSGKKLINNPENVVDEALEGLTMIHPGLRLLEGHRVVVREEVSTQASLTSVTVLLFQIPSDKVTIISGGGSGHEPFCAGYIGPGLLTAGVAGSVFASPPTASILAAIRAVAAQSKGDKSVSSHCIKAPLLNVLLVNMLRHPTEIFMVDLILFKLVVS